MDASPTLQPMALQATQPAEKFVGAPSEKPQLTPPAKIAKSSFSQAFKGFIARGLPDQNQRFETTDESRGPSGSSESRKSALPESAEISMPITHNFKLHVHWIRNSPTCSRESATNLVKLRGSFSAVATPIFATKQ